MNPPEAGESPEPLPQGMRNVLIIAYYFPPMGLSGVQRTLKFAKYLPLYGWQPTVLTVTPTGYYAQDPAMLHELDGLDIEIARAGSLDPNRMFQRKGTVKMPSERTRKLFTFVSDTFFIPDNKIGWKNKAVKAAEELFARKKFALIFATAPPFTDFLIGAELRKKFGRPLILDYRDPWHAYPVKYYPTPAHRWQNASLEKKALHAASRVIATNRRVKELILTRYGFLAYDDVQIIPQGYDAMDFERATPVERTSPGMFRITHAGALIGNRSPKYFLQAVRTLLDEHPDLGKKFELRFVGQFQDEYRKLVSALGLDDITTITGYVPHTDCIRELLASDLLWLMLMNDKQSPGKVYEYIGARKPILACVPDGFIRQTVMETGIGSCVDPTDVQGIATAIYECYEMHRDRSTPKADEENAQKYERKFLTGELSKIFAFLVD